MGENLKRSDKERSGRTRSARRERSGRRRMRRGGHGGYDSRGRTCPCSMLVGLRLLAYRAGRSRSVSGERDRRGGTIRPSLVKMKLKARPEDGERGARGACLARAFRTIGCVEIAGMAKKKK